METIMNQRFNYFIIFVGLVVAAAVNSHGRQYFTAITGLGCFIALFLSLSILRAHRKLNTVVKFIKRHDKSNPMAYVDTLHKNWWSARKIMGWVVPGACTVLLGGLAIWGFVGVSSPSGAKAKTEYLFKQLDEQLKTVSSTSVETINAVQNEIESLRSRVEQLKLAETNLASMSQTMHLIATNQLQLDLLKSELEKLRQERK